LLKSVITAAIAIQMLTLKVGFWAENAGVGVSQPATETMRIWHNLGGLKIQWMHNEVMGHVWEITESMSIHDKQSAGPKQWDVLIDRCVMWLSYLASNAHFGNGTCQTRLPSVVRN
jgi:hypothetical protein